MTTDRLARSEPTLYPSERQEKILALARAKGRVEVAALAEAFGVTTETVRRDLSDLQRRRLLRRVHGGAVLWATGGYEPLISQRNHRDAAEKERIAVAAVAELPPEGTVLLDSGTTTERVVQHLDREVSLTVVTNSVVAARLLADLPNIEPIMLGGDIDHKTLAVVGEQTIDAISHLRIDTLLLGTDGMSPAGGLTTPHRRHGAVKAAMIAAARRVVLLADASKAGHDHFLRFASAEQIDTLLTDARLDDVTAAGFEARGVTVSRV